MPSAFNNTGVSNPVKKYLKWSGSEGKLQYFDKESKTHVEVKLPFRFIKLEECVTISGYSEEHQSGIFSNEVYNSTKEELLVRTFNKTQLAKGFYQDIKEKIKNKGAKYTKSIYALDLDSGELVNIQLSGSGLSTWNQNFGMGGETIEMTKNPTLQKKGATKYFIPSFVEKPKDDQSFAIAGEVYKSQLKPWLEYSMRTLPENRLQTEPEPEPETEEVVDVSMDSVKMPF